MGLVSSKNDFQNIARCFEQFQMAYQSQNYGIAYQSFVEALSLNAGMAYRYFVSRASFPLDSTTLHTGKSRELATWLDALIVEYPNMHLLCDDDQKTVQRIIELRESNIQKGLPSIVLVTQGKAASVSVASIFNSGFNLPSVAYSFVTLEVIESWARDYARGGACYTTHLLPTRRNIACLKRSGIDKVIVHVRDPRQSLLSMIHHVSRYPDQLVRLAREFGEKSIAQQIDDLLAVYVSRVHWILGWIEAESEMNIMFSTFEEFVQDEERFIRRYLDFYGAPIEHFSYQNAVTRHEGTDYHFRSGEIAEWRDHFPSKQASYLSNWIPRELKERFGWSD